MRKIITLLFIFIGLFVKGQDIKPISPNFKNLQSPSWSYYLNDSSVWIYKGSTYGWSKLYTAKKVRQLIDSLATANADTLDFYKMKSDTVLNAGYFTNYKAKSKVDNVTGTLPIVATQTSQKIIDISINAATGTTAGSMSAADKALLDSLNNGTLPLFVKTDSTNTVSVELGDTIYIPDVTVYKLKSDSTAATGYTRRDRLASELSKKIAKVTSTDNAVVRFNGTSGDIKNSAAILDDAKLNLGNLELINNKSTSDITVSTSAVNTKITQTTGGAAHSTRGILNSATYTGSQNEYILYGIQNGAFNSSTTANVDNLYAITNFTYNTSGGTTTNIGAVGSTVQNSGRFNKMSGNLVNITNTSNDALNNDTYGFAATVNNSGKIDGLSSFQTDVYNSGAVNTIHGLQVDFYLNGGTQTTVSGIDLGGAHPWEGSAENMYGIYIDSSANIGTVNNYAIYSESPAKSSFTGNIIAPVFESTAILGTQPLNVISTTKVDSLNADLLDGYHYTSFEPSNTNIQQHITNDGDLSNTNEAQSLSVATNTVTLSQANGVGGGSVAIAGAGINSIGTVGTTITITGTEIDGSITNEGQLSTVGTTNNATIQSNTSGSNILNLKGSGINTVSASGNNITVTGTEIDGSTTNELQTISTTGTSGNITLSNGGGTLTLNVNDADASTTNEIQDLSRTGDILSLSSDATTVDLSDFAKDTDLSNYEPVLTKGNLTSINNKLTVTNGTGSVIGTGTTIAVNEGNLLLQNIGGAVTDTQVPNTITLDNITQITNRSHTNLSDIGTNSHSTIDNFISSKAQPNGLASLDANGKLPSGQLPSLAISETFVVANEGDKILQSSAERGDVVIVTSTNKSYILQTDPYSIEANWILIRTPDSPVQSVNGQTGNVVLTTTNINEGTNLYYTDTRSRAAISETVTGLDYNNTTGVISQTSGYGIPTTTQLGNIHALDTDKQTISKIGTTLSGLQISLDRSGGTITLPNEVDQYVGTVTSVTAGNGMTQTGTSTVNPTLNVVSHAGTAGSIGTINIGADAIGVNLGTTSTTAMRGDATTANIPDSSNKRYVTDTQLSQIHASGSDNQTLTVGGTTSPTIALSGSNTATFASGTGITLGQSAGTITITNNSPNIIDGDGITGNEYNSSMTWTDATNTVGVVDGGGTKSVAITGFLETEVDPKFALDSAYIKSHIRTDLDKDPDNELQDLSLSGNTLSLSGDASTVDLSTYINPTNPVTGNTTPFATNTLVKATGTGNQVAASGVTVDGSNQLSIPNTITITYADQALARLKIKNSSASGKEYNLISGRANESQIGFQIFNVTNNRNALKFDENDHAIFGGSIQATTGKFTNLTDGYIPYHISDASGLGDSPLFRYNTTNLIVNSTVPYSSSGGFTKMNVYSAEPGANAGYSAGQFTADISGVNSYWVKSRGTTIGAQGAVVANDNIRTELFEASGGTAIKRGARFDVSVDGSVSTNIVPMRFVWQTMNSAGTLAERMRLASSGNLLINTTTDDGINKIQVNGSMKSSGLTLTNLTGTGTRLATVSSTGVVGVLANGSEGYIPKIVSGAITWVASSVSEVYRGTWSAATNTPTLANGTGTAGDYYICSAAGTVNFGAGNITFATGDRVSYNGSIWQYIQGVGYNLQAATASVLGGVKIGSGVTVQTDGTISVSTDYDASGTANSAISTHTSTYDHTKIDPAYNDKINSLAFTGTFTKTLTLTQEDGGTVSNTFTDIDTNTLTDLTAGTITGTSYGITSDGSSNDIILPIANTTQAGLLSSADKIILNNVRLIQDHDSLSTLQERSYNSLTDKPSLTQLHDPVTLAGTYDYLTLTGQQITRNQIDYSTDISNIPSSFTPSAHGNEAHTSTFITDGNTGWDNSYGFIIQSDAVVPNTTIMGATKTKITYDSKGLVTSGTDATTADIASSTDKRYITDAQLVVVGNTSGTNTGDETQATIITKLGTNDNDVANEGSLSVLSGMSNTSIVHSNTTGSTDVIIQAGTGLSISESGNTIVLTNTQTGLTDGSITYERLSTTMTGKQTVTSTIDFNASGIGEISLSGNTTFSFTNLRLNKIFKLKIITNGYTVTLPDYCKNVVGSQPITGSGTFYLYLDCWNSTSGSEEILLNTVKLQ